MSEILPPADPILWVLGSERIENGWIECAPATWLLQACEFLASAVPLIVLITLLALAIQAVARCAPSAISSQTSQDRVGRSFTARGTP